MDWDWEYIERCQYPVYDKGKNTEIACGEPAIARIMWDEEQYNREEFICQEHLNFMLKCEAKAHLEDVSIEES